MKFKLKAFPSAKREAQWLCQTYGADFTRAFNKWRDSIVEFLPNKPSSLPLIPLEDVLDRDHSIWGYVWKTAKDKTVFQRIKALMSVIRDRKPPYELHASEAQIFALASTWIEVIAIVHVDRVSQEVWFVQFIYSGLDSPLHDDC